MYTIGEVSDFLGLSRDTLKFYEKKGLITPQKDHENGYRCYSDNDIYDILIINFYRDLDMEVKEIQGIQDERNLEDINSLLTSKISEVEERIKQNRNLLKRLQTTKKDCEKINKSLGKFTIKEMKPMEIIKEISHTTAYYEFPNKSSIKDTQRLTFHGLYREILFNETGITRERYIVLKETKSQKRETISFPKCLYTVIESGREDIDQSVGDSIRSYAMENKHQLLGICYVGMLLSTYRDNLEKRYLELFIPIKP